jgi:hypothetical protein
MLTSSNLCIRGEFPADTPEESFPREQMPTPMRLALGARPRGQKCRSPPSRSMVALEINAVLKAEPPAWQPAGRLRDGTQGKSLRIDFERAHALGRRAKVQTGSTKGAMRGPGAGTTANELDLTQPPQARASANPSARKDPGPAGSGRAGGSGAVHRLQVRGRRRDRQTRGRSARQKWSTSVWLDWASEGSEGSCVSRHAARARS